MKFTIHNKEGIFLHVTKRSLQSAVDYCRSLDYDAKVCMEYKAPSPFDKSKITLHGKTVFKNYE